MSRIPSFATQEPSTEDFELCKTIGHAWEMFFPTMVKPMAGWRFSLLCNRCLTQRHDIISRVTGRIIQRTYWYMEGYRLPKGSTRPTRPELRLLQLTRLRTALNESNAIAAGTAKKNGVEYT